MPVLFIGIGNTMVITGLSHSILYAGGDTGKKLET